MVVLPGSDNGDGARLVAFGARQMESQDAVAAFGDARVVELASPSTPEAIYTAIMKVRGA